MRSWIRFRLRDCMRNFLTFPMIFVSFRQQIYFQIESHVGNCSRGGGKVDEFSWTISSNTLLALNKPGIAQEFPVQTSFSSHSQWRANGPRNRLQPIGPINVGTFPFGKRPAGQLISGQLVLRAMGTDLEQSASFNFSKRRAVASSIQSVLYPPATQRP